MSKPLPWMSDRIKDARIVEIEQKEG